MLDRYTEVANILFGAVKRALCGGRHGGLYCIWKVIEMEGMHISLGSDFLKMSKV